MRRIRDIGVSLVGLVIASPLMVVCALMIVAESGGPVLFRQLRVGKAGKCFRIHKFRTMKPGVPVCW